MGIIGNAVGGFFASKQQNENVKDASKAQLEGQDKALEALTENFRNTVLLNLPRAQAGDSALAQMMTMIGLPAPDSLTSGDAYEEVLYGSPVQGGQGAQGAQGGQQGPINGMVPRGATYSTGRDLTGIAGAEKSRTFTAPPISGPTQNGLAATSRPDLGTGEVAPFDITQTPGYQFRFNEGIRSIDSSAAAGGRIMSGAAIRRLNELGQGLAGEEFSNQFNRLASIASGGTQANQTISGASDSLGANSASLAVQGGQARASAYAGRTNPLLQGFGTGVGYMNGLAAQAAPSLFGGA